VTKAVDGANGGARIDVGGGVGGTIEDVLHIRVRRRVERRDDRAPIVARFQRRG